MWYCHMSNLCHFHMDRPLVTQPYCHVITFSYTIFTVLTICHYVMLHVSWPFLRFDCIPRFDFLKLLGSMPSRISLDHYHQGFLVMSPTRSPIFNIFCRIFPKLTLFPMFDHSLGFNSMGFLDQWLPVLPQGTSQPSIVCSSRTFNLVQL